MAPTDRHSWARVRLAALAAGLLESRDDELCREHLAECEACRSAFEDCSQEAELARETPGGHVPAGLIARWDTVRQAVKGLERLLIRRHLESCEECRHDLTLAGHEPVLGVVPDLELAFDPFSSPAGEPGGEPAAKEPGPAAGRRRADTAGLAEAERRVRTAVGEWLNSAAGGWGTLLVPVLQLRPTRGGAAVVATLDIGRDTHAVALPLPLPLGLAPESFVEAEIDSPAGEAILRQTWKASEVQPLRLILLMNSREPLVPGIYRLRLRCGEPSPLAAEYAFELRFPDR